MMNIQTSGRPHRKPLLRRIASILPNRVVGLARQLRDGILTEPYSRISYAQEGEDLLIRRMLEQKQHGFYVDVGAHHPTRFSNTYLLYRRGWRGINIDATPGSMAAFRKRRPRDINLEVAVGEEGSRLLYMFDEPALNSLNRSVSLGRHEESVYSIVGQREVSVRPLSSILGDHLPSDVETIDLMSIDVEGDDFEVIRSNDWGKYRPRLLLIEVLESDFEGLAQRPEVGFLRQHGYTVHAKLHNTVLLLDKTSG